MKNTIVLEDIDQTTYDKLQAEAKKSGLDIKIFIVNLLKKSLGVNLNKESGSPFTDLDHLAGT